MTDVLEKGCCEYVRFDSISGPIKMHRHQKGERECRNDEIPAST